MGVFFPTIFKIAATHKISHELEIQSKKDWAGMLLLCTGADQ